MGQIVTFFSYKGGVGRTMALANVAVILAQWGKKVLVVDWDLEAPGIESYFKSYLNLEAVKQQNGVIDLLHEQLENNGNLYEKQIWRDLLTDIKITGIKGNLHLLTAGKRDNEYFRKVRSLDFKTFYSKEKKGLFFIESLRNEWKKEYDYVFIDSRTGITDTGGICTIQLPDILVLLFTATDQALTGVIEVAEKVSIALQKLPFDRLRIVSVPIPSKFDTNTEFDISNEWLNIFSSKLTEIYADWLPTSVKGRDILEITKIPYVPYFSFGEKLPVLEQGTINPSGLGYAYETLAALLGNNLELVEHLIEDRDGFVRYASRKTTSINPNVFISYSHKDEKWKDRLRPHLGILEKANRITIWDDRQIDPDGKWFNEIKKVIDRTSVAVCLISSSYLASDFINKEEIPYLLSRRGKEGMIIIPVLLKPCTWKAFPWLRELQMLPHDGKTISKDFKDNEDEVFGEVAEQIFTFLDNPKYRPPQPTSLWSPPEKIDINRLPMTGEELFGRQNEMEMLEKAWEYEKTHVVILVAWGGVGKSNLVNKWLEHIASDNYRGARKVFAWSFFSQGTGERVTSADLFISEALTWFGDSDPKAGSPWDKGMRLADLVRKEKTLLILDGLEQIQSYYEYERGKIKDPALSTLIVELARQNNGLCVITTRENVADLAPFTETTCTQNLEHISAQAGRAILRVSGVQGSDAELEAATSDFGNHALSISLLGVYLHAIPDHNISSASGILDLDVPEKEGRHPRRVIAAFEQRYGEGPEIEVLRMLGLFYRPADAGEIAALKKAPSIPDLTENIHGLLEVDWLRLLQKLRQERLIAPESKHQPDTLDAHPLVREHFGQQLREAYPEAWLEGNNRLYEHLKQITKELPDTIEEMMPLYAAVIHGCQAGRYQEVIDEVYWPRILRRNEHYSWSKLGSFGADLAALSGFFNESWSRPVIGLREDWKGCVLNAAGFALRALGRLAEAAQPMKAGLEARVAQEDWLDAARSSNNLSELSFTMGDLAQALEYAEQSVDLADRSGDTFERLIDRTTLADALHQTGRLSESENTFQEAEEMQKEYKPKFPLLYSLQGFRYCDMLLGQGKYRDVLSRVEKTLDWGKQQQFLLDIALDHLSLGKAHLLQAQQEETDDFTQAEEHLNQAVDGLRTAGRQDILPLGLLAHAKLYRVQGAFEKALRDLDEAMTIAERGEMGLHQADCHLEYAQLYLAMGEKEEDARRNLDTAKEMIGEMGYHRRDTNVREIEEKLL